MKQKTLKKLSKCHVFVKQVCFSTMKNIWVDTDLTENPKRKCFEENGSV